jgi:hypothetical protein
MKWPLILSAAIVLLRMILEQAGAPEGLNNLFGVAWLYFVVPVYFAYQIAGSGEARPYKTLFRQLLLFVTYTRLMIMPAYWLAYALRWTAPRFWLRQGGVVGEGVSPLQGYLLYPVRNALVWIIAATIIGIIIGSITLKIRGRAPAPSGAV